MYIYTSTVIKQLVHAFSWLAVHYQVMVQVGSLEDTLEARVALGYLGAMWRSSNSACIGERQRIVLK